MRVYSEVEYKDKKEIRGIIFTRQRNIAERMYFCYKATRIDDNNFELDIYRSKSGKHIVVELQEDYDGEMMAKNIVYWIEQRIENIWREIKGD